MDWRNRAKGILSPYIGGSAPDSSGRRPGLAVRAPAEHGPRVRRLGTVVFMGHWKGVLLFSQMSLLDYDLRCSCVMDSLKICRELLSRREEIIEVLE